MSRNNIRVARGIRQTLPPNTILGNPYSTPGPAIIMTPAQLAGNLLNTGQVSSTASQSSGGGGSPWTSFTQGTPTTITINSTAYTAVPLSPDIFPLVAGASTLLGARLTPGATFNKCGFALVNGSGDGYYLAIQSDSNLVLASFTASGQSIIDAGPGSHGTTTGEGYYNGNWKNSGQFDQSYQWLIEAEAASANGFWVQQGLGAFLGFSADTTYDLTSGTWGFYFFYAVGDDPVLDWAGYTTPPLGSVLSVGSVPIVLPPGTTATTQSSGDTSTKVATDAFVAAAVGANQLTGDVTAGPGAGSQVATLATVNTDVGSYTLASVTVNAKGLVTAASSGSVSVPSGADPSGTAGPSAVDGSATTFMRSDGAPAVQKASSSQFGIVEVDNTTITASSGVISTATGALTDYSTNTPAESAPSTTSLTMMGFGSSVTFTPKRSGIVLFLAFLAVSIQPPSSTGTGQIYKLYMGSGTAPAYGAALTGTVLGFAANMSADVTGAAEILELQATLIGSQTGLTLGTTYWVDFAGEYAGTQANSSLSNYHIIVAEL